MERDEIAAAYKAALERKKTTRRNPDSDPYTRRQRLEAELDGVILPRFDIYAPEFRGPQSAADWWDDRVLEHGSPLGRGGFPESPVLIAVAAAARDDAEAARGAVKAARQLDPAVQWSVYENLGLWRRHEDAARFGADRIIGQVLAEWEQLKLRTTDPAADEQPARRRRRREMVTEAAS